ncbi:MAG: tyrosine-type recombinase/integrase [Methylobacter sp.]
MVSFYRARDGTTIRQSAQTDDKRKAQELADKHKAQLWDQIKLGHKPQYLWEDAVVKWVSESQKKSLSDDVVMFRYLDKFFSGVLLSGITRDHVEKVIADKLGHATPGRANRVTALIRAVLRKAEREWGWIDKAPSIRRLKEDNKRIRWITRQEAERLCREPPDHLEAMARFSLATGLREANVTGLEWSQVDMQRKVAWVHADQAKAKKAIGIPLNADAIHVIRSQIGKHDRYVFTYKGKPVLKAGGNAWKKALGRARITNFRWHDLRHTWASWHVQAGTPLNVLQEVGGWSEKCLTNKLKQPEAALYYLYIHSFKVFRSDLVLAQVV